MYISVRDYTITNEGLILGDEELAVRYRVYEEEYDKIVSELNAEFKYNGKIKKYAIVAIPSRGHEEKILYVSGKERVNKYKAWHKDDLSNARIGTSYFNVCGYNVRNAIDRYLDHSENYYTSRKDIIVMMFDGTEVELKSNKLPKEKEYQEYALENQKYFYKDAVRDGYATYAIGKVVYANGKMLENPVSASCVYEQYLDAIKMRIEAEKKEFEKEQKRIEDEERRRRAELSKKSLSSKPHRCDTCKDKCWHAWPDYVDPTETAEYKFIKEELEKENARRREIGWSAAGMEYIYGTYPWLKRYC